MVKALVVEFVERAPRGSLFHFGNMFNICFLLILVNLLPVALCASTAQVYALGDDVPAANENFMWVDRNPFFDAAMERFNIEDTESHPS